MTDPLADVLRSVRLTGGLFLDVRLAAPWAVLSEITAEDCLGFVEAPAQIICYHVALKGRFFLEVGEDPRLEVRSGEIVLLPRNDRHILSSQQGLVPIDGRSLIQPSPDGGLARIASGGDGEETHMVCGFLGSEERFNPLLASLPRALKLDIEEGTSREWIEASVRFAARELAGGRLASSSVMSRLSEVLFVEAVRQYASSRADGATGWLRGFGDPQIGRALAIMHRDLGSSWSIEELARSAALSRSAFVERFTSLVGLPPIRYVTFWRMQMARHELRETGKPITAVAHAVGYESEEAFSRAFKRECGVSPAQWRARHRA